MGHATRILFVVSLATLMLPDTVHAQGQREGRGAPPAQAPGPQAPRGGGIRGRVDSRVQQRTYLFKDTNEELPYALFVSSKVSKNKENPLIVALHGLGGDQNTMVRESFRAVELAEDGGYILVAPMSFLILAEIRTSTGVCAAQRAVGAVYRTCEQIDKVCESSE